MGRCRGRLKTARTTKSSDDNVVIMPVPLPKTLQKLKVRAKHGPCWQVSFYS